MGVVRPPTLGSRPEATGRPGLLYAGMWQAAAPSSPAVHTDLLNTRPILQAIGPTSTAMEGGAASGNGDDVDDLKAEIVPFAHLTDYTKDGDGASPCCNQSFLCNE